MCGNKSRSCIFCKFSSSPFQGLQCKVDTDYVLSPLLLLVVSPFSFVELPVQLCKLESHCPSKPSLGVPPLIGHCLPLVLFWLYGINMRPHLFKHEQDGEKSIADTYQYVTIFYTHLHSDLHPVFLLGGCPGKASCCCPPSPR